MKKLKITLGLLLVICLLYVLAIKPRKVKAEYQPYFAQLNYALKEQRGGASAGVIDLDRLDTNIQCVRSQLGNNFKLRLTTKSLPSIDLLKYLMAKTQTNRLMVFSEPFIAEILFNFNPDSLDILLGKPLPVDGFVRLAKYDGWSTINWLIDTKQRLNEYLYYARKENVKLKIDLEIDVGLHRGGFDNMKTFDEALDTIQQNSRYLQLTGLMGYDGHVPYVPFYINKERAIRKAFENVQHAYTGFVTELAKYYPPDYIKNLTFNGGGSHTYYYYPEYKRITPVNDIAMGSGFLAPAQFSELEKLGHRPALFLTSPVLKKIESSALPHAEKLTGLVNFWDPNLKVSYFLLGGGWPGNPVAPAGIQKNPLWDENDLGYTNLLPNQSIVSSSDKTELNVGDFVFYHAWEGDGMLSFKKIELIRQGKIVGEWDTYRGAN
jgi:Alanine racemase, N-terminal domain